MKEVRSFLTTTFYTQASNTTTKLSEFQVNLAHFKLAFSLFSILAEIVVSVSSHLCQKRLHSPEFTSGTPAPEAAPRSPRAVALNALQLAAAADAATRGL